MNTELRLLMYLLFDILLAFLLLLNCTYFQILKYKFKQIQVQSNIDRNVQRYPIYPQFIHNKVSPIINISHKSCKTLQLMDLYRHMSVSLSSLGFIQLLGCVDLSFQNLRRFQPLSLTPWQNKHFLLYSSSLLSQHPLLVSAGCLMTVTISSAPRMGLHIVGYQ